MPTILEFYEKVVGCNVEFTWESPPSYAVLTLGENIQWHLAQSDQAANGQKRNPFVYVYVHDTDAMYELLKGNGAKNITPPENASYGMRDFELIDPENNVIVFGKSID